MKLTNFEEKISSTICQRGEDYYSNGAVTELEHLDDTRWVAIVEGTEDYDVEVEIDAKGTIVDFYCDCPYDGDICKHVVATLFKIRDERTIDITSYGKKKKKTDWQQIISRLSPEELREFIIEYAKSDKTFRDEIKIRFAEYDETGDPEMYRKIIRDAFNRAGGRHGFIGYREAPDALKPVYDLMTKANKYVESRNFNSAFTMVSVIAPECIAAIDYVDGSDGEFGAAISEAFKTVSNIYNKCNDAKLKDSIFEYMLKEAGNSAYNDYGCGEELEPGLLEMAETEPQKQKLNQFVDNMIEKATKAEGWSKQYKMKQYLGFKSYLLEKEGKIQEAEKIITDNIHISDFRQQVVDAKLAAGEINRAIKLIEDGIEIAKKDGHAGTETNWKEQLLKIYIKQNDTGNARKQALELYFKNRNILKYYRIYKSTWDTDQWPEERERIIEQIKKGRDNSSARQRFDTDLASLYVEEEIHDKLYEMVEKYPMLNILISYAKHLKGNYSAQLLKFFKSGVEWYLEQNTGRSAYRSAIEYFEEMKKLQDGSQMVAQMVDNFKEKYKNRPAMFDEFRSAGLM